MAKHPVPKKKSAKARSSKRYKHFRNDAVKKLSSKIHLENCPNCGSSKLIHFVCKECGKYRGKTIIDKSKEVSKITKIKV